MQLHKGKGDRTFTTRVNFTSTGFATPPTVALGLSAFDILVCIPSPLCATHAHTTLKVAATHALAFAGMNTHARPPARAEHRTTRTTGWLCRWRMSIRRASP